MATNGGQAFDFADHFHCRRVIDRSHPDRLVIINTDENAAGCKGHDRSDLRVETIADQHFLRGLDHRSYQQALDRYYRHQNANVHRAVHMLAERATQAYEGARDRIAAFVGAQREEIVFTRGTTEAVNLVAHSFVRPRLVAGDEILIETIRLLNDRAGEIARDLLGNRRVGEDEPS